MKPLRIAFTLLFFGCALQLLGQNPLVGTWERQTDSLRATKIITPTHWAIFIETLPGQKLVRTHGGTYTLNDKKYIEQLDVASWENKSDLSFTDYDYTVEGDKFYQKGTLVLSDGSVMPIDEVWQKVSTARSNPDYPAIGTWNLASAAFTGENGQTEKFADGSFTRFEIITPTHWIRISHRDQQFESAMGGTYTAEGSKATLKVGFASFPLNKIDRIEVNEKVSRNERKSSGIMAGPAGKQIAAFEEVYRKATGKTQSAK
jgi:hypothetical protein